jgi:hypothetical protein
MRACSRDASGSSTRTWHFDDRPTVTTPRWGSGCEKNASVDMTNRCSSRPAGAPASLAFLSVISVFTTDQPRIRQTSFVRPAPRDAPEPLPVQILYQKFDRP